MQHHATLYLWIMIFLTCFLHHMNQSLWIVPLICLLMIPILGFFGSCVCALTGLPHLWCERICTWHFYNCVRWKLSQKLMVFNGFVRRPCTPLSHLYCTLHSPTVHIQCAHFFNQFIMSQHSLDWENMKIGWEKCVQWTCAIKMYMYGLQFTCTRDNKWRGTIEFSWNGESQNHVSSARHDLVSSAHGI